jgi:hypothetical protein
MHIIWRKDQNTQVHHYNWMTGGKKTWKHKFIEYCLFDIKLQSFNIHMLGNIYNSFFFFYNKQVSQCLNKAKKNLSRF